MADEITRQTAGLVAAELGAQGFGVWTVDAAERFADYPGVYLDGPGGARLYLRPDWRNQDRLEIHGVFPDGARDLYGLPDGGVISVGRMRGPDVIAREIARRLLPVYRDALAVVLERVAAAEQAAGQLEQVRAQMFDTYPRGLDGAHYPGKGREHLRISDSGGWYGDVDLYHDGARASLNLRSLPAALALEVLRVLEGWRQ